MKHVLIGAFFIFAFSLSLHAESGVAQIRGTSENYNLEGTVTFLDTKEGLKISARLKGAPPGTHGFHIHEFGSCENGGNAAGSHYNPLNVTHGLITKDGHQHAHLGDLGNIVANSEGTAELDTVIPKLTLTGEKYSVAGRAVILHEKVDDFGQPVGNAGGRIGCGTIIITGK